MTEPKETFYQTMGLATYSSVDEVRTAYRRLINRYHPDRNPEPEAIPIFQSITEAYRILSDPTKKSVYDAALRQLPSIIALGPPAEQKPRGDISRLVAEIEALVAPPFTEPRQKIPLRKDPGLGIRPARMSKVDQSNWSPKLRIIGLLTVVVVLFCGAGVYFYWPYLIGARAPEVGKIFSDCSGCPSMIVVPAGRFSMGLTDENAPDWARPVHEVLIKAPFAIGRSEVTNQQFVDFLNDTIPSYDTRWIATDKTDPSSHVLTRLRKFVVQEGFEMHPAVNVSWLGATAYVQWLSNKTSRKYRLPSESEWEYSARAGTETKFYSGQDTKGLCEIGNVPDMTRLRNYKNASVYQCDDGYAATAPIGKFKPNAFGLYDTLGNAWEWVQDCWHRNYEGAPEDGSTWIEGGECQSRVLRGNGFASFFWAGVSARAVERMYRISDVNGFRIVRDLN